jgi:hypothetical protein
MPFERGNKYAKGGARPGGGRKPEWLTEKCRDIVESRQLVEFLADVAAGEKVETFVTPNGKCVKIPASIKDRREATQILLDRGFGKPAQEMVHSGEVGGRFVLVCPESSQ